MAFIGPLANTNITGTIIGSQLASGAAVTNLGYTPPNSSNPSFTNVLTQTASGSGLPFIMKGGSTSAPGTSWFTVHTFAEYASTAFFLMVSYEDNNGDGANRSALFVDAGTSSYGGGFGVTRLAGSTSLEAQRGGTTNARTLEVRHNAGGSSGAHHLQWQVFLLLSTSG